MGSKAFGRMAIISVLAVSLVFLGAGFGYAQGKFPSRPASLPLRMCGMPCHLTDHTARHGAVKKSWTISAVFRANNSTHW